MFPNNAAEAGRNPDTLAGERPADRRACRSSGCAADAPPGAAGRQTPARRGRNAVPGLQDIESDTGYDTRRRAPDGGLARLSQTTVYDTCGSQQKEAAGLDHGSCFADIEGRSSFHENRAGDVSGGEVAFMIESRREEAVEVYGTAGRVPLGASMESRIRAR